MISGNNTARGERHSPGRFLRRSPRPPHFNPGPDDGESGRRAVVESIRLSGVPLVPTFRPIRDLDNLSNDPLRYANRLPHQIITREAQGSDHNQPGPCFRRPLDQPSDRLKQRLIGGSQYVLPLLPRRVGGNVNPFYEDELWPSRHGSNPANI